jgi:hypothetical protein
MACELDLRVRDLRARPAPAGCTVLWWGGADVDGVDGDRTIWRRCGSVPCAGAGVRWRRRATAQQGPTNTTLAAIRTVATDCRWFRSRPESVVATAARNDQQKCPALT